MTTTVNMSQEILEREARIHDEPMNVIGSKPGFFRGALSSQTAIWGFHELLGMLVRRELKARYKDSALGIVWSFFRPLAQLLIYYFAIGKVLGAARSVPDFAIFVFIGITMWGLFAEIVSGSTTAIMANAGLVKKVYIPREIFTLSAVGSAIVNFLIQSVVLLLAIQVLSHFRLSWDLLLAPLAVVTLIAFSTALGLVLSALNVYLRDIEHFVEIAVLILFWASPIVYSFKFVHEKLQGNLIEQLYLANPATISILGIQKALWAGGSEGKGAFLQTWPPDLALRLFITLGISLVLLWVAQRLFSRLQGNFAQEL